MVMILNSLNIRTENLKYYAKAFLAIPVYAALFLHSAVACAQKQKDTLPQGTYCLIPELVRQNNKSVFIPSPSITYSPETSLSLGVYAMYYFKMGKPGSCTHPSNIQFSTAYTLNNQYSAEPQWEVYTKNDEYVTSGRFLYQIYPEKFFGIGNNTRLEDAELYAHQLLRLNAKLQKRWYNRFFFGPQYQMQYMFNVAHKKPDGILAKDASISGRNGGFASGLGFAATWDSRDLILFPQRGIYADLSATFFSQIFGSGFPFQQYTLDARKYFGFGKRRILAFQVYSQHNTGNPPFRMLALMGNNQLQRGYYQGRYRDRDYLAAQAEYRFPVYKRFGMTAFAGAGQVAHTFGRLQANEFHPSYGFGLRYLYNSRENINIRADFGFGPGTNGQYITVGEAF